MGISVLFLTEEECLIIKQPLSQSLIGNTAVRLWPPYTSPWVQSSASKMKALALLAGQGEAQSPRARQEEG